MKLEYVRQTDANDLERSIVRLYDFEPSEVLELIEVFRQLSNRQGTTMRFDRMSFIEPIEGCRLLLKCGDSEKGMSQLDRNSLECELKKESWKTAALRAESLVGTGSGPFQWLYDVVTPIEFLLSHNGGW